MISADQAAGTGAGRAAALPVFAAAGTDPTAELDALRNSAGLVDRSARSRLRVEGSARVAYLHRVTAQSIAGLAAGSGIRAALLERTGKIIDVATVLAFPGHLLWIAAAGRGEAAAGSLRRTIFRDDVRVEEASAGSALFLWTGPRAGEGLAGLLASGRAPDLPLTWEPLEEGHVGGVVRMVPAEPPAFLVLVEAASSAAVAAALVASVPGGRAAGGAAFDGWRILHGVPEGEREIDAEANPLELGLDDALDLRKGCFTGQEAIAKMITHHAVRRRLVGVRLAGAELPVSGTRLWLDADEVGRVTTAVRLAGREGMVGLALVRSEGAPLGTRLRVGEAGEAEVVALPFATGAA